MKMTPPKLRQQLKTHEHMMAIAAKAPRHKKTSRRGLGSKMARSTTCDGAVLIHGKKHKLPVTKGFILKECHDTFCWIGTLPGDDHHITLKKDCVPVQHP